ncbi:unnamed protein product [Coccothraustes coccothraustes]
MLSGRGGRSPAPGEAAPRRHWRGRRSAAGTGTRRGVAGGSGSAERARTDSPSRTGPRLPGAAPGAPLCKWLRRLCLEHRTEGPAVTAARKAVGAGTESHRQELLTVLRDLITPDL